MLSRSTLTNFLLSGVVTLLLACTHTPASAPEGDVPQAAAPVTAAEGPASGALPDVDLGADLLYDLMLSEIAIQRGELNIAAEALSRAAESTVDPRIAERATRAALQARRFDLGIENARLWSRLKPDATAPIEAMAVLLLEDGKLDEAEAELDKLLETDFHDRSIIYRRIADLLSRQDNQEGALQLMDRLVAANDGDAVAHYAKAYLADRLKRPELVATSLDRALALRPDWEDAALAKLAHLISQKSEKAEVMAFADTFLGEYPDASKVRLHYGRYLVDQGENELALAQFAILTEKDPENADASFAAGLLSIQLEQFDKAREFLTRNLEQRPENDQARFYLGQVANEQERFDEAEKWYREVRDQNYYLDAQMQLADVIAKSQGTERALQHLRSLHPRNEEEYVRLVLSQEHVLREAKDLREAKMVLDSAMARYPENSELLYARGLIAAQLELLEVHEADMRKLLEKDPQNAHALNALGYTLADSTDRHEEAEELIKQALAIRPDDPFILDSMGWVQYRLGNLDLAIQYLEQALDKRADAEIAAHLGEVLWVTGQHDRAEAVWTRAKAEHPDNDVLLKTIKKFLQ